MLKFSNEDYSIPRERSAFQRGMNRQNNARNNEDKFSCDGSRSSDGLMSCGIALPATCGGNASLASVYSPYQEYTGTFDSMTALCNGTLFKELYKPLKGGMCNG